jgi:NADPH:quinone reductase-like Zn-dependent oxidoreductase
MSPHATPSDSAAPERTVPKRMHAVAIDRFGGPEVLVYRQLPPPVPGPDDVLIEVHTAGVYAYDYERRGFYAQYVAVSANHVGRKPTALNLGDAGAVGCVGLTALQGIDDALQLRKDESIVVHGASGGVGHLAVQFAKLRGARVLASASGEDGAALVRHLGADESIDGKRVDVAAAARRFAAEGLDAVLALVGGDSLERLIGAVRDNGRVAHPNGVEPIPRTTRGIEIVAYDAVPGVREFDRLSAAIDDARLKVHIGAEFPLAQAERAHRRIEAGHILGKIVLRAA